jgi:hypothetical protein
MPTQLQTSTFVWAMMVHLVADWLFQTEWMVANKSNVMHVAAWVHSGIHALGLLLVLPWYLALGVGITHLLIDTRILVNWWMTTIKGVPKSSPTFGQVELWVDQVFHLTILAVVVLLFAL